jgi:hypothetical protein
MIKWLKYLCGALGVVAFFSLFACSPTQASAASLQSSTLAKPAWPYSQYTLLVSPASGGKCHTGGMKVEADPKATTVTAEASGHWYIAHTDDAKHTVTFPDLPPNYSAIFHVPAHTDLNLKECGGDMKVSAVSGQMDLSSTSGMEVSKGVRLLGTSQLYVDKGTLNFDGSLDQNSTSTFDSVQGVTIKLPKSDAFHIDATTSEQWGNVNANPGSFCQTPRPNNNACHGSNQPGGLSAHLSAHAQWNIAINLV